jgi:hypothetical protein
MKVCLDELSLLSCDADTTVREKATGALVRSIRSLVFKGFTKQAKEGASNLPADVRPVLRAELREFVLLNNSEHSPIQQRRKNSVPSSWMSGSNNWHPRICMIILWKKLARSLGIIISNRQSGKARIRELAARLLWHKDEFEQQLPWLNSDKARSSVEFGVQLGRLDEEIVLLERIVAACRDNRNPNLARGYFAGVSENIQPKLPPTWGNSLAAVSMIPALCQCITSVENRTPSQCCIDLLS